MDNIKFPRWGFFLLWMLTLGLLLVAGCSTAYERPVRVEPDAPHDLAADQQFCREYAELYGVIHVGPLMGDKAPNQPDTQRRKKLYRICMEEKGYGF